jgi:glutaredoxin-like protein
MTLTSREGQRVPDVTFKAREYGQWKELSTADLFAGKTVIVFSLPGAFTPTCSTAHVPRYNELVSTFKANGVDDILCVSVNDAFVMEAWQRDQNAMNIRFIPDGNGDFSRGMGMLVNKEHLGFGDRAWRYSMLVKDGVIEKMFIEPDVEGDPFEVSDADTLLNYINADAVKPQYITMFSKEGCPHCARAKKLLADRGLDYEEITLGHTVTTRSLRNVTGKASTPQIYIGGQHIGGADELESYFQNR